MGLVDFTKPSLIVIPIREFFNRLFPLQTTSLHLEEDGVLAGGAWLGAQGTPVLLATGEFPPASGRFFRGGAQPTPTSRSDQLMPPRHGAWPGAFRRVRQCLPTPFPVFPSDATAIGTEEE